VARCQSPAAQLVAGDGSHSNRVLTVAGRRYVPNTLTVASTPCPGVVQVAAFVICTTGLSTSTVRPSATGRLTEPAATLNRAVSASR